MLGRYLSTGLFHFRSLGERSGIRRMFHLQMTPKSTGLVLLHMIREEANQLIDERRNVNDHECTLGYFTRTLAETRVHEDIHREIMKLQLALGSLNDTWRQYHRLVNLRGASSRETHDIYQ